MIPKSVKIGATVWRVEESYETVKEEANGLCEYDSLTLKICPTLHESQKEITFVHELLHAITHMVGIGEKELTEEDFVTRISPLLHTVLSENDLSFLRRSK